MEINCTRFREHFAIKCSLSLENFCRAIQHELNLPNFEFDFENETEWGLVKFKGIEYNVSRPFEKGTLQEWDETVPLCCNFGISLAVANDLPPEQNIDWSSAELVPEISQLLANLFDEKVYHHRTWLGVGKNLTQKNIFYPKRG